MKRQDIYKLFFNSKGIKKSCRSLFEKTIAKDVYVYTLREEPDYVIYKVGGYYFAFYKGILLNRQWKREDAFEAVLLHGIEEE